MATVTRSGGTFAQYACQARNTPFAHIPSNSDFMYGHRTNAKGVRSRTERQPFPILAVVDSHPSPRCNWLHDKQHYHTNDAENHVVDGSCHLMPESREPIGRASASVPFLVPCAHPSLSPNSPEAPTKSVPRMTGLYATFLRETPLHENDSLLRRDARCSSQAGLPALFSCCDACGWGDGPQRLF